MRVLESVAQIRLRMETVLSEGEKWRLRKRKYSKHNREK